MSLPAASQPQVFQAGTSKPLHSSGINVNAAPIPIHANGKQIKSVDIKCLVCTIFMVESQQSHKNFVLESVSTVTSDYV